MASRFRPIHKKVKIFRCHDLIRRSHLLTYLRFSFIVFKQHSSRNNDSIRRDSRGHHFIQTAHSKQTLLRSKLLSEPAHGRPIRGPGNEQWGKFRQEQLDKYQADRLKEKETKENMKQHKAVSSPTVQELNRDKVNSSVMDSQERLCTLNARI